MIYLLWLPLVITILVLGWWGLVWITASPERDLNSLLGVNNIYTTRISRRAWGLMGRVIIPRGRITHRMGAVGWMPIITPHLAATIAHELVHVENHQNPEYFFADHRMTAEVEAYCAGVWTEYQIRSSMDVPGRFDQRANLEYLLQEAAKKINKGYWLRTNEATILRALRDSLTSVATIHRGKIGLLARASIADKEFWT